jgi:hypothetical protein
MGFDPIFHTPGEPRSKYPNAIETTASEGSATPPHISGQQFQQPVGSGFDAAGSQGIPAQRTPEVPEIGPTREFKNHFQALNKQGVTYTDSIHDFPGTDTPSKGMPAEKLDRIHRDVAAGMGKPMPSPAPAPAQQEQQQEAPAQQAPAQQAPQKKSGKKKGSTPDGSK